MPRAAGPRTAKNSRKSKNHTPVMQQFLRAKEQYPDAIVFFRLGDFYEMFFEDAERAAAILDIALTSRGTDPAGQKIPMAGVPHHAAAGYLAKLLKRGERVAICEQMADPSSVKGVVPREVVRVVTPGLCLESGALAAERANHLLALSVDHGMALLELSTGSLQVCALQSEAEALAEALRAEPAEILLDAGHEALRARLGELLPLVPIRVRGQVSDDRRAALQEIIDVDALSTVSAQSPPAALQAAWMALDYAQASHPQRQLRIHRVGAFDPRRQLILDETAVRNLELVRTLQGERRGSLLALLDRTRTPMGARMLRQRLLAPLADLGPIRRRHDAVEALCDDAVWRGELRTALAGVGDLERLATRAALGLATPRDLGALRDGLQQAVQVLDLVDHARIDDPFADLASVDRCQDAAQLLNQALQANPPHVDRQGDIFQPGFHAELDELRALSSSAKQIILDLEQRERVRTGIGSLKIKYTRVFGYYIEITRAHLHAVPDDYVRKQTVANAERFITAELSDLQERILTADERSRALEQHLFEALRDQVAATAPRINRLGHALAGLDVAASWAECAHVHGYVRPHLDDSLELDLKQCRHPVVEAMCGPRTHQDGFVPNDLSLGGDAARLMVLTGPNMSGKSTAMRQAALAVLMAQAGGFVAAKQARIGLVDRIFTRVGASDNLSQGQSTFLVEMQETSTILREATPRSLVILDEIGRGTSTYDGLAIAWAVTEHLHNVLRCRTIFATHYHELCALAEQLPHAVNFNVAATDHEGHVVFLHQVLPGSANRSYGIEVARLAGVVPWVIARAKTRLRELEEQPVVADSQPTLFSRLAEQEPAEGPIVRTLRALELDRMTPLDALMTLANLQKEVEDAK